MTRRNEGKRRKNTCVGSVRPRVVVALGWLVCILTLILVSRTSIKRAVLLFIITTITRRVRLLTKVGKASSKLKISLLLQKLSRRNRWI